MARELNDDQVDHIRELLEGEGKIQAIKVYREITGSSLAEAKGDVERIRRWEACRRCLFSWHPPSWVSFRSGESSCRLEEKRLCRCSLQKRSPVGRSCRGNERTLHLNDAVRIVPGN